MSLTLKLLCDLVTEHISINLYNNINKLHGGIIDGKNKKKSCN